MRSVHKMLAAGVVSAGLVVGGAVAANAATSGGSSPSTPSTSTPSNSAPSNSTPDTVGARHGPGYGARYGAARAQLPEHVIEPPNHARDVISDTLGGRVAHR